MWRAFLAEREAALSPESPEIAEACERLACSLLDTEPAPCIPFVERALAIRETPGALQTLALAYEVDPIVHLMPLVLPGMYERKWGRVIGLAMHPDKPSPAYAYNLGKAARLQIEPGSAAGTVNGHAVTVQGQRAAEVNGVIGVKGDGTAFTQIGDRLAQRPPQPRQAEREAGSAPELHRLEAGLRRAFTAGRGA